MGVLGLLAQQIGEVGRRPVEIAQREKHLATMMQRIDVVRPDPERFVAVTARGLVLAKNGVFVAAIGEAYGVVWSEPEGFIVIAHRALMIALVRIGVRARVVRIGIGWVEPDGVIGILDCTIIIILTIVDEATVVVRPRVIAIDLDRLVAVFHCEIVVALLVIGAAAIVVQYRKAVPRVLARLHHRSACRRLFRRCRTALAFAPANLLRREGRGHARARQANRAGYDGCDKDRYCSHDELPQRPCAG